MKFAPSPRPLLLGLLAVAAVSTSPAQTIYVSSSVSSTVGIFDTSGDRIGSLDSNEVGSANGLVTDPAGNVYLANGEGNIEEFSADGTFLSTFASTGLSNPMGLAIDTGGNIYAANFGSNSIEKFSPTGTDLGVFFDNSSAPLNVMYLNGPTGLAFGPGGNLYVANYFTGNVWAISSTGTSLGQFADANLYTPGTIAFNQAGQLYVSNQTPNTIEKFDSSGGDLATIDTGDNTSPNGLAFDQAGNLYAVMTDLGQVFKYDSSDNLSGGPLKVRFDNPSYIAISPSAFLIPEPSSWALMAGAFMLLLVSQRNRVRRAQAYQSLSGKNGK